MLVDVAPDPLTWSHPYSPTLPQGKSVTPEWPSGSLVPKKSVFPPSLLFTLLHPQPTNLLYLSFILQQQTNLGLFLWTGTFLPPTGRFPYLPQTSLRPIPPVGLWDPSGTTSFARPRRPWHPVWSITQEHGSGTHKGLVEERSKTKENYLLYRQEGRGFTF